MTIDHYIAGLEKDILALLGAIGPGPSSTIVLNLAVDGIEQTAKKLKARCTREDATRELLEVIAQALGKQNRPAVYDRYNLLRLQEMANTAKQCIVTKDYVNQKVALLRENGVETGYSNSQQET
ncbi:hypothetical protein HYY71_01855 [Candidatus Woesearchaeota archaeon]|nr:hypothetical protein [Candidatus Woesearchaeota archaeon]